MSKLVSTLLILISVTTLYSQRIIFSNSFVGNSNPYKIIGKVANNFVVWTATDDQNTSEFLIYNDDLKILKKVHSNFFRNQSNSTLTFFNNNDSFSIAYRYKKGNVWQYRLTFFDAFATELSTIIIDSSNSLNKKIEDNIYYTFLQSQDKKTTCFTKFAINADSFVLKISCAFINNHIISNQQFILPFDFTHETINDFLVDSNNIVLLETVTYDSSFLVKLIKKSFSNDYLLISSKRLESGSLMNGNIYLTKRPDMYLIYGAWQNQQLTGFYKWTTDLNLNDEPGDTVLKKVISPTKWNAGFIKSEKDWDLFTIEKYRRDTSIYTQFEGTSDNSLWQNELMRNVDLGSLPHISEADKVELGISYHYQDYSSPPPSNQVAERSMAKITESGVDVFSLSNLNQINWFKNFDSINTELRQNLDNKKIVAGKNAIHIIYTHQLTNNSTGISQIIVSYTDGSYHTDDIPTWTSAYIYLMDQAIEVDSNSIIIPCFKGKKLFFAKLLFEIN